jgi:hypothetical protein
LLSFLEKNCATGADWPILRVKKKKAVAIIGRKKGGAFKYRTLQKKPMLSFEGTK